jgi:hypothetical protein
MTIDEFKKKNNPTRRYGKKSKLEPYRDDILKLYDDGYRVEDIGKFLLLNGIQISRVTIYQFIAKQNTITTTPKENNQKIKKVYPRDLEKEIVRLHEEGYTAARLIEKLKEDHPGFEGCRVETISRILKKLLRGHKTGEREVIVKNDGRKAVLDKRTQKKSRLFPHK